MAEEMIQPWPECASYAYAENGQKEFHAAAVLSVPVGYEGVVFKDVHTHTMLYPGEYPLADKLNREKRGFGKAYLTGRLAYVNKAVSYKVSWGTGEPVVYLDPTLARAMRVGFSGSFSIKVDMAEPFVQYTEKKGASKISLKDVVGDKTEAFLAALNPALKYYIETQGLDFRAIPARLTEIAQSAEIRVRQVFTPIGVWVSNFVITGHVFPESETNE